jgi:Bacterial SH3 domain.
VPRPDGYVDRFAGAELNVADGHVTLSRQWEIEGYLWTIGSWSSKDDRAIISIQAPGSEYGTPLPAILHLDGGGYNLIPGPFKSERPGYSSLGRTAVRAVQTGPFARVTGTGSCLKVRAEPSLNGEVLTCAVDGVLLRDTGQTNGDWVSVMTPGGTQGWASAAFLER